MALVPGALARACRVAPPAGVARLPLALLLLAALTSFSAAVQAQPLSAKVAVEGEEFFLGESFLFQIQVAGSDAPDKPDLSSLTDFSIEDGGGQQNNSTNVQIIGGRMMRTVYRGYVFSYRLTPKRAGALLIPALEVAAEGRRVRTQPLQIRVTAPAETADFKLRQELSRSACYVGEPLLLTVTWYLGKQPKNIEINLPVQDSPAFTIPERDFPGVDPRQIWKIGRIAVLPRQGQGRLGAQTYTTITFDVPLLPKQAGTFEIPQTTVGCHVIAGQRRSRSPFDSSPFGDFFQDDLLGDFGLGRRNVYRKVVVPSNPLTLQVKELPAAGQPPGFAGHVGDYRIAASASPTEVNVGDPITLTIRLSGPEYLDEVTLPPLDQQPALARDFRVPKEMAPGRIEGAAKVFTQTLRAAHENVSAVPPIELAYFDTRTEQYRVARTEPIPLTVKATKVVTASDAEGRELVAAGKALKAWSRGIAHNYEDLSVLDDQHCGPAVWLHSPLWMSTVGAPPLLYFALLTGTVLYRRRSADPAAGRARRAYSECVRSLKRRHRQAAAAGDSAEYAAVLEALRSYLGDKLRLSPGALTFADVTGPLEQRGVPAEVRAALKRLFDTCEAGRYAGGAAAGSVERQQLLRQTLATVKEIERTIRAA